MAAWALGTTADHRPGHGPVPRAREDEAEEELA
jgi:hypothetical protein